MKKILLSLLIFVFILWVSTQANEVNNGLQFYYIRAREFKKPSNEVRTEAGKVLVEKINNAQKTIDFAFYGLSKQDEILNALINAQKRGVKIRGIVDKDELNFYKDSNLLFKYFDNVKNDKLPSTDTEDAAEGKNRVLNEVLDLIDNKDIWE